jgi:hypothetical protein
LGRRGPGLALLCAVAAVAGTLAMSAFGAQAATSASGHRVTIALSGAVHVDGRPTFLRGVGWISPESVPLALDLGVNTFLSRRPGRKQADLAQAVGRRGFVVPEYLGTSLDGLRFPNAIGYVFEDEPDGRSIHPSALPDTRPVVEAGRRVFLTLSPSFLQRLPKPAGIGMAEYEAYVAKADVIVTDPYPRAHGCVDLNAGSLSIVYDVLLELAQIVRDQAKAIGEWIETGPIEGYCGTNPVPPQIARAEAWAAVAGGAKVILWFTHSWTKGYEDEFDVSREMAAAIRTTNRQLTRYSSVFLSPRVKGIDSRTDDPIKVGVYMFRGKAYLVAVNLSEGQVTLSRDDPSKEWMSHLPGLRNQSLTEVTAGRMVKAKDGGFDDSFQPFDCRIYSWIPRAPRNELP